MLSRRRLGPFLVAVNACALATCALALAAAPVRAEGPDAGFGASLLGGYAFRAVGDGRQHGLGALASVDSPSWGAVALRFDVMSLYLPGSTRGQPGDVTRNLALPAAALSLTWRFDDSDIVALAGVGPLLGLSLDGSGVAPVVGALPSLGLHVPLLPGADLEARLLLPVPLWWNGALTLPNQRALDDGTVIPWPLQVGFLVGVHVDPFAFLADDAASATPGPEKTPSAP